MEMCYSIPAGYRMDSDGVLRYIGPRFEDEVRYPMRNARQSKATLCPVCGGNGTIKDNYNATAVTEKICHGCNGKGWVSV